jgi:glycosyltransferase involved in cell wall biosynthesis
VKDFAPDVIVVIRAFPEGLFAHWCHVKRFVLRTAGSDISYFTKIPFLGHFIRSTIRRASYIITQSEPEKKYLQQELGVRCPIGITNIGVDTAMFKPADCSNRAKFGLCQNTVVVVSNRYLGGVYNGFATIEAFLLARKRCSNLELLYISPSPIKPAMRNKIESISRGVDGIHIVEGPIPHEEMAQALGCGDIWISLSSVDGIPSSLLEAMSCGLVPIVGELQPLREWVQHDHTGFLVPPQDVAAMADMMVKLGENKVLLKELSHRCRQKICQDGSYEKNMRNMMDMALAARNSQACLKNN